MEPKVSSNYPSVVFGSPSMALNAATMKIRGIFRILKSGSASWSCHRFYTDSIRPALVTRRRSFPRLLDLCISRRKTRHRYRDGESRLLILILDGDRQV